LFPQSLSSLKIMMGVKQLKNIRTLKPREHKVSSVKSLCYYLSPLFVSLLLNTYGSFFSDLITNKLHLSQKLQLFISEISKLICYPTNLAHHLLSMSMKEWFFYVDKKYQKYENISEIWNSHFSVINKVLLKHSHSHSFIFLLLQFTSRVEYAGKAWNIFRE
jgi:hypothetical protein